jgi:hypothetical protein
MELKVGVNIKGNIFEGRGTEIVQEKLYSAMHSATKFLEGKITNITPQGVGGAVEGLRSTVGGEVVTKGIPIIKGIVFHGRPQYGDVIEKGRRVGKGPPEGKLLRWIEVKLGVDKATAKRLEFVIRRKIGQKGFPGAHMFERGFTEGWPILVKIFDQAGFEITRELNG